MLTEDNGSAQKKLKNGQKYLIGKLQKNPDIGFLIKNTADFCGLVFSDKNSSLDTDPHFKGGHWESIVIECIEDGYIYMPSPEQVGRLTEKGRSLKVK